MRNRIRLALALALCALIVSCAVQRSQAPQISAQTAAELNFAVQLQQVNDDYKNFFRNVGKAKAAGQLTQAQVDKLAAAGREMKEYIEQANGIAKTYESNRDESLPAQIVALIGKATQIYLSMVTDRAAMLAQKGKQ